MDGVFAHIYQNKTIDQKINNRIKISIKINFFKINVQITLPVHTVNCYLVVYIYIYMQISFNIIDILCLHIYRITFKSKRHNCSTMWVGRQRRRFLCLFWRETRQRILGHEISPYPEVGRGRERELTTWPGGEAVDGGPGRVSWRRDPEESSWRWTAERRAKRVGVEPWTGAVNTGLRRQ